MLEDFCRPSHSSRGAEGGLAFQGPVKKQQPDVMSHKGGGQRPKKVCVPKFGLKFPGPLINFIFFPEEHFLCGWVGGLAGVFQDHT